MKSSTLRRSNLSKEKIAVLEELAKTRKLHNESVETYGRQNKDKELDVLWQNFRVNQRAEKSPGVYLITGFIAGAVAMLILTTILSWSFNTTKQAINDFEAPTKVKKEKLTFIPADKKAPVTGATTAATTESYTVQSGDTLESIIIRFYGGFGLDKVEKIKQANGMADANSLQIGQKLIIPME